MRQWFAMMMIMGIVLVPGLVIQLGCNAPCKLARDPDCDPTKLNTPCGYVCAPDETPHGEMNVEQGSMDSADLDGGADGATG